MSAVDFKVLSDTSQVHVRDILLFDCARYAQPKASHIYSVFLDNKLHIMSKEYINF